LRSPRSSDLVLPLVAPGSVASGTVYSIPYSYLSHEVTFTAARDLWLGFHGVLSVRYEHRTYLGDSFILAPQPPSMTNDRQRIDDRVAVDASLRHAIGAGFAVELAYAVIANVSTIDNTRATTPLDYDDKNYVKQVIELDFSWTH
jgi:hypothetical protein